MAQNCPEKYDTLYTQEVVLYQSDFGHPEQLKTLISESWNSAVLDSAANEEIKHHRKIHIDLRMENYFQHFKMLTYQSPW